MKGLFEMNKDFFKKNRLKLSMELANGSILIMFAGKAPKKSNDYNYKFTPNRNFYYLCGVDEEHINLVVIKDRNGNIEERLYIRKFDEKRAKWVGKSINVEDAKKISGINDIRFIDDFKTDLNSLISTKNLVHIYLDLEKDAYEDDLTTNGCFAKDLKERYSQVFIHNVYPKLSILRMCKEKEEIKEIIEKVEKKYDVDISATIQNNMVALMSNINDLDLDYSKLKDTLDKSASKFKDEMEALGKELKDSGFFDKLFSWISDFFSSLFN
ncbi:MAG TPA: hypothetical protein DDZ33_06935 [Clostridium sp.]|nr:hypothetical protein [Clostridium sp.]